LVSKKGEARLPAFKPKPICQKVVVVLTLTTLTKERGMIKKVWRGQRGAAAPSRDSTSCKTGGAA
jgi:hypothetical protein